MQDRQVVVFRIVDELYAVDVQRVQEIIRWRAPRPVAGAVPGVCGVINLRGRIVPVCDLTVRIGAPAFEHDETAKIVVVENAFGICGFVVQLVEEVSTFSAEQIDAMPPLASEASYVLGIAKVDDRLIVVLEPDHLFDGTTYVEDELPLAA